MPTDTIDFQPMRCDDLMRAKFEIRFLVDKVLVAGQPFILAGPKKALKTTLLIDMAVSLARAGLFLGKFSVPEAVTVGLMTGESGLATVQETIRRVCWAAGFDPSDLGPKLIIMDRVPQFARVDHLDAVRSLIAEYAIEVLIVDPVYLCIDGADAGNLFAQGVVLGQISKACQECGATLILAHHTKKSVANPHAPPELEDISWAGFQEFARQWLLVARRVPYQPGTGEHHLWMTVGGSVGHGGLWGLDIAEGVYDHEGGRFWQVDILDGDQLRQRADDRKEAERAAKVEEKLNHDKRRIVEELGKLPKGETRKTIRESVGMNPARFNTSVASLFDDDTIKECMVAKANNKRQYEGIMLVEAGG